MIRINIVINTPYWYKKIINRIFTCKHVLVSVTENPNTKYGAKTCYYMCLKCGRKAMDVFNNCKHEENAFGRCKYCYSRLSKNECQHDWDREPDTNDYYCGECGEWKN